MGSAGTLTYSTNLDTKGFQKGINDINGKVQSGGAKMKNIIASLGIAKLVGVAIGKINENIDNAVNRLDTMNNFPKVMSNLGISAKESQKAINKLSEGLQGIPTSLDAGALAVQRFTSKNGDVQKSVDIFLAVNDAILAGGASTQIQESALEQLSQAYSKGKMDMMEWRTLQTAMPAQLKQVADVMGLDVDTLGEMMRQGDNTQEVMDEFIKTIIKMDKEGIKGFKSLKEQSRNATGGIKTNITNLNTAITRGVANVINGLDKGLKKANLGGIGQVITNIGKTTEKVLNNIAKRLSKIDFGKLINTLKSLIPIVGAVVTAFVAYETSLKVIKGINIVNDIISATKVFLGLVPAITSATVSQNALNMAMSLNPIGLVVASVTALTVGLGLLIKTYGDSDNAVIRTNNTIKEYKKSMEEADQARQEYLDDNMNELKYYEDLSKELDGLVDENGKVKSGYEERVKFILGELSNGLGVEMSLVNGVVQGYEEQRKSISKIIEQKRANILMDAEEKKYNDAKDQRNNLEKAYTEAVANTKEELKEYNSKVESLRKEYGLSNSEMQQFLETGYVEIDQLKSKGKGLMELKTSMETAYAGYNVAVQNEQEIGKVYAENQKIIGDYESAMGLMADGNYQAVLKMYEDTTNYQGKTNQETYQNYQNAIDTQKQYLNDLKTNKFGYDQEYLQSEIGRTNSVIKNLQDEQAKYSTTVAEGQKKTTEEWNKGLSDQLSKLTGAKVKFQKTADGHIQAYISGQKAGKPMSEKEAEKFGNDMAKEIGKAKREANKAGENLVYGTKDGINNRSAQNSAFGAISSFGSQLLGKLKASLKEHSPSTETRQYGKYLLQGLGLGIEDEESNVLNQIEDFGDEVLDRMENAVNMETGKMSFNGTAGSVSQILSANAQFEGTIPLRVDLDGEKIYDNQQKITARKSLQYGGAK